MAYFAIKGLNVQCENEVGLFSGRMDISIEENDDNYSFTDNNGYSTIIEVKYTQIKNKNIETLAKNALNQIKRIS
ncbi:MAG: PD-(D/E)XK nuclease domain-containing protein [Methanobrevibacter sp.]|nr:PD-(D/E)XK nuclease domain-containing protein [Methanobrevibacter sp.]